MYFISYSSRDGAEFAARLAQALASGPRPLETWIAESSLVAGSRWDSEIEHAIISCDALLFVATTDSIRAGSQVSIELRLAFDLGKPVVPLRLDHTTPAPLLLQNHTWIDFTDDFDAAIEQLREHLLELHSPEGLLHQAEQRLVHIKRDLAASSDSRVR